MEKKDKEKNYDEKRDHPRAMIQLSVEYSRLNTFFRDYTCNISQGGMFIKTEKPMPVGSLFQLKLVVPELPKPLKLQCEVRWTEQLKDLDQGDVDQEPGMGIRFLYETEQDRRQLEIMVEWLFKKHLGEQAYRKLLNKD